AKILEWEMMDQNELNHLMQTFELRMRQTVIDKLRLAKLKLMNAQSKTARQILESVPLHQRQMAPVLNYYLALVSFIEGNYQESLTLLEQLPQLNLTQL